MYFGIFFDEKNSTTLKNSNLLTCTVYFEIGDRALEI